MSDSGLSPEQRAEIDAILAPVNHTDTPGCVVGVRWRDRVVYRRGVGMASLEQGIANTPDTRMRIGSTSKQFTCLAALLLGEDGALDVDAPATDILPELQVRPAPSLRQLMNHTGGLRCHLDLWGLSGRRGMLPSGWAAQASFRQRGVNFAPGEGQLYCNAGYHLLTLAIERAAAAPFEQFLKTRIFEPLGMVATEGAPSDMTIVPGKAMLHIRLAEGGYRRGVFPTEEIRGEGNLVSTVDDMLLWLSHLNAEEKRVGSPETWRQLQTPTSLPGGLESVYALGLYHHRYRGARIVHHAGAVVGGSCQMLTLPAHGLEVVIIANGGPINPVTAALAIVDVLLEDVLGAAPPPLADTSAYRHLVDQRYHGRSGHLVSFGDVGGKLGLGLFGGPPWPIMRDDGHVLRVGFEDAAIGPLSIPAFGLATCDGRPPPRLVFSETGVEYTLERVPETFEGDAAILQRLTGRFESSDLAAEATIAATESGPVLTLSTEVGFNDFSLRIRSEIAVEATPLPPAPGDNGSFLTLDVDADQIVGFRLDSGRARRIAFVRRERQNETPTTACGAEVRR